LSFWFNHIKFWSAVAAEQALAADGARREHEGPRPKRALLLRDHLDMYWYFLEKVGHGRPKPVVSLPRRRRLFEPTPVVHGK